MLNLGAPSGCHIQHHAVVLSLYRLLYISKHIKDKMVAPTTYKAANYPLWMIAEMLTVQSFIVVHCPVAGRRSSSLEWDGEEICSSSYEPVHRKVKKWMPPGWLNKNKYDWKTGVLTLTLLIKPEQFFIFSGQSFCISGMKLHSAWRDADGTWENW